MPTSDKFEYVGDLGTPERHVKVVGAVWAMTPRTHVWIGCPSTEQLASAWKEITGQELEAHRVDRVRLYPDGNK